MLGFDPYGNLLPHYPIGVSSVAASPVVLASAAVVFASNVSPDVANSPAPPPFPTLSPPRTPSATPTATVAPTLTPTTTAGTTATAHPSSTRLILPLLWRQIPAESRLKLPIPVHNQTQLHVLRDGEPRRAIDVGRGSVSEMAVAGDVAFLQVRDERPRLVAIALDTEPPRVLWEHRTRGTIAGGPILGRFDAVTGMVELIYADDLGTLVSLKAPATASAAGPPTFNWAVTLDDPVFSAPALGDAGQVYVVARWTVLAFDRAGGRETWRLDLSRSVSGIIAPAAVRGHLTLAPGGGLLAGSRSGLIAVSTESRGLDPDALWPTLRHDRHNTGRRPARARCRHSLTRIDEQSCRLSDPAPYRQARLLARSPPPPPAIRR